MSTYNPELWCIVKTTNAEKTDTTYKVLASWYGGFLDGDSWNLSSGTKSAKLNGEFVDLLQYSGSTYRVHKNNYGISGYTSGIFASWMADEELSNYGSIELLTELEAFEYICSIEE